MLLGLGFGEPSLPGVIYHDLLAMSLHKLPCVRVRRVQDLQSLLCSYKVTSPPGLGTQHYDPIEPELPP